MYYANPWINLSKFLFPSIEPQYVYNDRGYLASEMWVNNIKDLHRIGGPAITDYNDNGTIKALHWYKNGHLHNEDGPALIEYYDNMKIKLKHWKIKKDKTGDNTGNSTIKPAELSFDKEQEGWVVQ